MSQERKKVEIKPVGKPEPVKRERPQSKVEEPVETKTEIKVDKPKKIIKEPKVVVPEVKVEKPLAKKRPQKVEELKPAVIKTETNRKPAVKIVVEEDLINPELVKEFKKNRPKSDDKYIRFAAKDYQKDKITISERVLKDEIKFAYFAIDGDDFYHYYILTKK